MTMPKAYSYIRMSTMEQLKGDSARRQFETTQQYCLKHGLELHQIINDEGVSAFSGANVNFGKLAFFLTQIETGKIEPGSYLIIESLDRLSRQNLAKAFHLLTDIVNAGIIVVTLSDDQKFTENSIADNPNQLLFAVFIMIRAHEESRIKSQRVGAAWEQKRKQIQSGLITRQRIPAWLKFSEDGQKFEVLSDRKQLLEEIFILSKDGYGAYSIARRLNERKELPWGRGKVWQESYIKKILNNRSVLGEFQPMKFVKENGKRKKVPDGDLVMHYYPQVISDEIFDQSRLAVSSRKLNGAGRKGKSNRNLFSGLLKCAICEGGMRFINKGSGPKGGKYLRCAESLLGGECHGPAWRYSDVEEMAISAIDQIDFEAVMKHPSTTSRISSLRAEKHSTAEKIESLTSKIDRNAENILDIENPPNVLFAKLADMEAELADLVEHRDSISEQLDTLNIEKPKEHQNAVTSIIKVLKEKPDDIDHIAIRRKLSAELRLVLSYISVRPTAPIAWELIDQHPDWLKDNNLTLTDFERICHRFSFELRMVYHNGDMQIYEPLGDSITLPGSQKMQLMKEINEL